MNASVTPDMLADTPSGRFVITPAVEALVTATVALVAVASYFTIVSESSHAGLMAPAIVATLLIVNLIGGVALLMLVGRRIAMRRAVQSPVGGGGRLHVRLVALFSAVAAVPMVLVAIAASLLFQYGVQFWYSDRARGMLENAAVLAQTSYEEQLRRWEQAAVTMADDMSGYLQENSIDNPQFPSFFFQQVYFRSLSEGVLFAVRPNREIQTMAIVNPYDVDLVKRIDLKSVDRLRRGEPSVTTVTGDRIQVMTALPGSDQLYLYVARVESTKSMTDQTARARAITSNYRALLTRARSLQLQFNAALLIVSLLIVGFAVWIALMVADRLVRPVGELVDAARRVAGGDLRARVADPRRDDEVGTLANAFNQMTVRLEEQNTELLTANDQLEARRRLIEAVMAGVSAGVLATDRARSIQIANESAIELIGAGTLVGENLADVTPELAAFDDSGAREGIVQVARGQETRTLAVRIARTDTGPILTFDDITQQVLDQRRAAWSDVARRIAHEIKNPLTPIQLAAERLQRRYGGKIEADDGTFARLTDTIVRQVGDLRRMVDEFSSFARMPKPVFREESLVDIARQSLFLHEVARADIRFELDTETPGPDMVCDRRQLGQAFTNIVKNAVEAIEAKDDQSEASIVMRLRQDGGHVIVEVADTGVGLPADRDRIVEPYMTTRARGTGLGLAIVKKIVEEHLGTMTFADRPGGGTVVRMQFDAATLASFDKGGTTPEPAGDGQLAALSRNRN